MADHGPMGQYLIQETTTIMTEHTSYNLTQMADELHTIDNMPNLHQSQQRCTYNTMEQNSHKHEWIHWMTY